MSTNTTAIAGKEIISLLQSYYNAKDERSRPAQFGERAINTLLEMQETTAFLFSYTWCQDYVDILMQALRGCMCMDYVDRESMSEDLDTYKLPDTITLDRKEASNMFFIMQLVIKYLGDMNHLNELFENVTTNPKCL